MCGRDPVNTFDDYDSGAVLLQNPLLRLWRTPGLNRFFNAALPHVPTAARRWIEGMRERARRAEMAAKVRGRSRLVPEREFRALLARGLQTLIERVGRDGLGDYLEFGVYNGTSITCMFREVTAFGLDRMRLFGFDSFQGLPPYAAEEDEGRWRPGSCYSSLAFTRAVLEAEGVSSNRVTLVPGWFSETLNDQTVERHGLRKASVIMIDCDLYSSSKEALTFCAPLIRDHALVLFDEWRPRGLDGKHAGERRAFEEFLRERPEFTVEPFGSYIRRAEAFLLSRTA